MRTPSHCFRRKIKEMLFHPPALACILRHLHPRHEFAFRGKFLRVMRMGEKGKSTFGGMFEGCHDDEAFGWSAFSGWGVGTNAKWPVGGGFFGLSGRWNENTILRIDSWLEVCGLGGGISKIGMSRLQRLSRELKWKLGMFVCLFRY
jgi:hypothetical protein